MIDEYLKEYKYLKEFDRGSGISQNLSICGQVLGSLSRVLQIHKIEDISFTYSESNGLYYKEKENLREEIDYVTYRANTFMDEFLSIQ